MPFLASTKCFEEVGGLGGDLCSRVADWLSKVASAAAATTTAE